ncbi:MAG: DUF4040 domain-containing protein [Legionellaceae bacterium]|nr:DUF4040 domain-containing protein [Legionellaceae bacterium]
MMVLFDSLLILSLLWLAWRALTATNLFQAVVLFIAFGLLMALIWARLRAPDIAMAEAAIGSGLTGALFLATLGRLHDKAYRAEDACRQRRVALPRRAARLIQLAILLVLATLAALSAWALCTLPTQSAGLLTEVQTHLHNSGVRNPVTAVLLNFRAYDTLLEIAVLLLAVIAVWSLAVAEFNPPVLPLPLLQSALVHLLSPVMLIVAGYALWIGTSAPGGAFQAGAILGGAGVLLLLSNAVPVLLLSNTWPIRGILILGLSSFILVACGVMLPAGQLLQYPPAWAGALILCIEITATLSIAATLSFLFIAGRPPCPAALRTTPAAERES